MVKLKTFEVLISEEVAYKYRLQAKNEMSAQEIAMDRHTDDKAKSILFDTSIDRCEIINCKEIK